MLPARSAVALEYSSYEKPGPFEYPEGSAALTIASLLQTWRRPWLYSLLPSTSRRSSSSKWLGAQPTRRWVNISQFAASAPRRQHSARQVGFPSQSVRQIRGKNYRLLRTNAWVCIASFTVVPFERALATPR